MSKFPAWEVYNNVLKQIAYSGGSTEHKKIDKNSFITKINTQEYVVIESVNRETVNCVYIIIKEGSTYGTKSADVKNVISKFIPSGAGKKIVINLVTKGPLTPFTQTAINLLRDKHGNIEVNSYPYKIFLICIPEHHLTPKHELMSPEDANRFIEENYIDKSFLPEIKSSDPMAIWIGAKKGDVIKVSDVSGSAGISYAFCQIIG